MMALERSSRKRGLDPIKAGSVRPTKGGWKALHGERPLWVGFGKPGRGKLLWVTSNILEVVRRLDANLSET